VLGSGVARSEIITSGSGVMTSSDLDMGWGCGWGWGWAVYGSVFGGGASLNLLSLGVPPPLPLAAAIGMPVGGPTCTTSGRPICARGCRVCL